MYTLTPSTAAKVLPGEHDAGPFLNYKMKSQWHESQDAEEKEIVRAQRGDDFFLCIFSSTDATGHVNALRRPKVQLK